MIGLSSAIPKSGSFLRRMTLVGCHQLTIFRPCGDGAVLDFTYFFKTESESALSLRYTVTTLRVALDFA